MVSRVTTEAPPKVLDSDPTRLEAPHTSAPSVETPYGYRPEIDGLRALAIIAVIANHVDRTILPSGYLGVDVFFVISGYVVTSALARRRAPSAISFLTDFYARRAQRLLPALVASVLVSSVVASIFTSPLDLFASLQTGLYALFGLSNIHLYRQSLDYFSAPADLNVFLHTWSLGVEEQFYLLYPVLFFFLALGTAPQLRPRRFMVVIAVLASVSLFGYAALLHAQPHATYYLMPLRFWELALGALAAVALSGRAASASDYRLTLIAFCLLLAILFVPIELQLYATIGAVACSTYLLCAIRPRTVTYSVLTLRPMLYIGAISYSLYLWHWGILALARRTIGVSAATIPPLLILMLMLASASYLYLERPLRYRKWASSSLQVMAYAAGVACLASVGLLAIRSSLAPILYAGTQVELIEKGAISLSKEKLRGTQIIWDAPKCVFTSNSEVGKAISFTQCRIASPDGGEDDSEGKRFLVIGNSFSAAEWKMIEALADHQSAEVTLTSSWGASPVAELPNTSPWSRANAYYWTSVVPSLLGQLRQGDFVVMINDLSSFAPETRTAANEQELRMLERALENLAASLHRRGISIIFQSAIPFLREAGCTPDQAVPQWFHFSRTPLCKYHSRARSLQRRAPLHEMLLGVQQARDNFFVLDLYPILCPGDVCGFQGEDGTTLYRDEYSHMSVEAGVLARPILKDLVTRAESVGGTPRGVSDRQP